MQILLCASNKKLQLFWNLKGGGAFAVPKLRLQIFLHFQLGFIIKLLESLCPLLLLLLTQIRQDTSYNQIKTYTKMGPHTKKVKRREKHWKNSCLQDIQSAESDSERTFFETMYKEDLCFDNCLNIEFRHRLLSHT